MLLGIYAQQLDGLLFRREYFDMKRFFSLLLILLVCAGAFSMMVMAAPAVYDVWVGGVQFDAQNLTLSCDGGGTATLDVTTNPYTLTLDHAVIKGHSNDSLKAAVYAECGLNIILIGENKLGGSLAETELERGIHIQSPGGDLSVSGGAGQTGSLAIYVKDSANYKQCVAISNTSGNVCIEDTTVTISENEAENEMTTGGILGNQISIKNSSVTVQGFTTGSIHALDGAVIENSTVLLESGMEEQGMGIRAYGDVLITDSDVTINSFAYAIYLNHNADLTLHVSGGSLTARAVDEGWIGIVAKNIEMNDCELSVASLARTFYVVPSFANMELTASKETDGSQLEAYDPAKYKEYRFVGTGHLPAGFLPPVYEANLPFADVVCCDAIYDAVSYVYRAGLMMGTAADRFGADVSLNRAMIWTILARANGVSTETWLNQPWYFTARQWAMDQAITDGTGPERAVTKLELVTMLWRYMGKPMAALDVDVAGMPQWGVEAWRWAVENSIISGDWKRPATRGETAVALYLM